ncbi:MAG: hypothetical protein ACK52W_06045 [Alphaproteobacteria bacterium]
MKRFVFSKSKSYSNSETSRLNDTLRQEMLRTLEREANTLLKGLQSQFEKDLNRSLSDTLRSINNTATANNIGSGQRSSTVNILTGLTGAFGSLLRLRRPNMQSNSTETSRSQEAFNQFRLSRAQTLAEAGEALEAGERSL